MYLSTISAIILATLCSTSQAWEVVAYDKARDCEADGQTRYRVISGDPSLTACMTFDTDMPGTGCREYTNGGQNNGGCVSGQLRPSSMIMRAGHCFAWDGLYCGGVRLETPSPVDDCFDAERAFGKFNFQSFSCSGCKFSLHSKFTLAPSS